MSQAPSRPSTSTTLSWGLINVPVSLYSGTDNVGVSRKEFTRDGVSVGRASTRKDTNEVIGRDDVVKMAQATNGEWVELTDDEIAAVTAPDSRCVIEDLIDLDTIGTVYLTEAWYQVRPKAVKGHVDPNVAQGFALLMAGLADLGKAALIKIAMRGPARYAAVLPDGRMATLLYADGIREALPMPEVTIDPRMLDMACTLLDAIGTGETPVLTDTNGPAVQAFVDSKIDGGTTPPPPAEPTVSPDLMESLMASIKAGKTPVKRSRKDKGKGKTAA